MWIAGGQSTTANPIFVSVIPSVQVSGLVTVGTVSTLLGTVNVSLVPSASVVIAVSITGTTAGVVQALQASTASVTSGVFGLIVRVADSAAVSGTITVSNFSTVVSGTITVSGLNYTTATPTATATGPIVWLANPPGAVSGTTQLTVVSVLTTVPVAVSGAIAAVTTQTAVTGAGVWLSPTQTISVTVATGTVTVSGTVSDAFNTTTQAAVTGDVVWLAPTQTVSVVSTVVTVLGTLNVNPVNITSVVTGLTSGGTGIGVWPGTPVYTPFMMMVTSTAIAQSAAAYLMTIWTGSTVAVAGTSLYAVPAGKNLRILNMQAAMTTSAVVGGTVQFIIVQAANAASLVSGSFRTQGIVALGQGIVTALPVTVAPYGLLADVPTPSTIAPFIVASTAAVLQNMIIQGYLF
jgi:hypothetical protein